ncbi:phenylalanine--tRNA ligase subunit beta [Weissella coleopterorum]|uniref:Phenylalanine--tRNA ligase beta subunit n=1 Tax=Weissella coleopterorum TaxID=2714949 RepID=A0A6G8B1L9_9LACO|nr:phenylalanine--tRNA ligase subunit beta [Weissella coleopterorum]QIL51122.1 phenylalanine--tRNA ligase subunit beta [Weissella coleopterorum]
MKVSTNWLKDYMTIDLPVNELAEKISRTSVEIEGNSQMQGKMKKVVIAKVLTVEPHPDSDHMVITQVDAGEDEPIQIVTGAPNIAEGQTVILAKHGSVIGDGIKIKKGKLRGVRSNGMLCALQEIGLDDNLAPKELEAGIWVFNAEDAKDLVPGEDAFHVLGMDDHVLETGITPNRADMLSMNGTAFEVAAMLDVPLSLPQFNLREIEQKTSEILAVEAPSELASTYSVRVIKDVKVQDSPLWMQKRLWNMGIRPINNVVDTTNYLMLMYGQPLHAFDFDQLPSPHLQVRAARDGEKLTTLDDIERETSAGDILITANDQPLMFAGVMGGTSTKVTEQTTTIVLEAAIFEPTAIRHTARDQSLHSEASQRFERGVDASMTLVALDHAATLIAELGTGEILSEPIIAQAKTVELPVVSVTLNHVQRVLGIKISTSEVGAIFDRLQFSYQENSDEFKVVIPTRRWDISIAADLIEEIARMYGYDNLPTTLPVGEMTPGGLTTAQTLMRASRHVLEGLGLNQAMSYVLTTPEKAQHFQLEPGTPVQLNYPMSQDRQQTRSSLLTGLLDDVAYNVAHNQKDIALYEQGRIFIADSDQQQPREIEHLAGVISGNWEERSWIDQAENVDFYTLKGIVERLLANYQFKQPFKFVATDQHAQMHPGRTADIYVGDTYIGMLGQIHPLTAKSYKINETFGFELNLDTIIALPKLKTQYNAISRYPEIARDMAILVDKDLDAATLQQVIIQAGGRYLEKIELFDVYTGVNVSGSQKSLAYALTFVDRENTLTDEVVTGAMDSITSTLKETFRAEIR